MRLDKYLKVSRLVKRRTVANELCDAGHVEVNGRVARASYDVRIGDEIAVRVGSNLTVVRVADVNEYATKAGAQDLYEVLRVEKV